MPDVISTELRQVLRRLRLSPILETLPERLQLARQQKMPYQELIELILADECARRDRVGLVASDIGRTATSSQGREGTPTVAVANSRQDGAHAVAGCSPGLWRGEFFELFSSDPTYLKSSRSNIGEFRTRC